MAIGIVVGLLGGYFGGWVDMALMRIVDMFLGFPALILALAIVAVLGPGVVNVVDRADRVFWTQYARVVRASCSPMRARDYVRAAQAIGAAPAAHHASRQSCPTRSARWWCSRRSARHGDRRRFGAELPRPRRPPPAPTWGWTLAYGMRFLRTAPWLSIVAGLAIMITVLGFNLLGDGLRDSSIRASYARDAATAAAAPEDGGDSWPTRSHVPLEVRLRRRHRCGADDPRDRRRQGGPTVGISAAIHGNEQTGPRSSSTSCAA